MRREDDLGGVTAIPRQRLESRADPLRHRFYEPGVVVEDADLVEPHLMLLEAHHVQGAHDVLAVLPAAGIGAVGRRDEEEEVPHPIGPHRLDRVLQ